MKIHTKAEVARQPQVLEWVKASDAKKIEQERDALLALVERLKTAWDENADSATTPSLTDAMEAVFESSPPASLLKRDLIKQAEALEEMACEYDEEGHYWGHGQAMRDKALGYRQQAEGGQ